MFADIQSVPWPRLTCSYGSAEAVPSWLQRLSSPSPKMRAAALWRLNDALIHQGTVWTSAVAATPFLIALLREPAVGGKEHILDLLTDMMEGDYFAYRAADDAHEHDHAAHSPNGGALVDTDEQGGEHPDPQPQRGAIRASLPVYLGLLDHADPSVRISAITLLVKCQSSEFDPLTAFETAAIREAEPAVRAAIIRTIAEMYTDPQAKVTYLTSAFHMGTTEEERTMAALQLIETAPDTVPEDMLRRVVRAVTRPTRRVDRVYAMATRGDLYSLAVHIGFAMRSLPSSRLKVIVQELMQALPHIGRDRSRIAAGILVEGLFSSTGGVPLDVTALSTQQRSALDAIFDADVFWRNGLTVFTSVADHGLLRSRPLLATYLGRDLPPDDVLGARQRPEMHRPEPFTIKSYEARIRGVYGFHHFKRTRGYRFEPGPDMDLYSPNGIELFYFPKHPDAVLVMEREAALLSELPRLPLMRPSYSMASHDTRAVGRMFVGGLRFPGEPLTPTALERLRSTPRYQQFAVLLARFLRELHAVAPGSLALKLPTVNEHGTWERMYADVRQRLFDRVSPATRRGIASAIESYLTDARNWRWTPAIVHGDFVSENIHISLFHQNDAAMWGICGFWRAGLGDPAYDLATLLTPDGYGEEFVRLFGEAYPTLAEELPRAHFYATILSLRGALDALDGGDSTKLEQALAHWLE